MAPVYAGPDGAVRTFVFDPFVRKSAGLGLCHVRSGSWAGLVLVFTSLRILYVGLMDSGVRCSRPHTVLHTI